MLWKKLKKESSNILSIKAFENTISKAIQDILSNTEFSWIISIMMKACDTLTAV